MRTRSADDDTNGFLENAPFAHNCETISFNAVQDIFVTLLRGPNDRSAICICLDTLFHGLKSARHPHRIVEQNAVALELGLSGTFTGAKSLDNGQSSKAAGFQA